MTSQKTKRQKEMIKMVSLTDLKFIKVKEVSYDVKVVVNLEFKEMLKLLRKGDMIFCTDTHYFVIDPDRIIFISKKGDEKT